MPEDVNPVLETTRERYGYGQSGPVFLLPGACGYDQPEQREITCDATEHLNGTLSKQLLAVEHAGLDLGAVVVMLCGISP
jgi:hypothetical protein